MKHIAIIPLIGGFSIAATNVIGKKPEAVFSYKPFYDNDKLYLRYHDVPYFQLDGEVDFTKRTFKDIDIVHGIPPCSGLSACSAYKAGVRATANANDWMYKAAEFVMGTIQPKTFVFENAPGLFTEMGDHVRELLIEITKKHNYAVTFYKTNTIYHGIPQNRPRTYAVFVPGDKAPILEFFNKPLPSILEFL